MREREKRRTKKKFKGKYSATTVIQERTVEKPRKTSFLRKLGIQGNLERLYQILN